MHVLFTDWVCTLSRFCEDLGTLPLCYCKYCANCLKCSTSSLSESRVVFCLQCTVVYTPYLLFFYILLSSSFQVYTMIIGVEFLFCFTLCGTVCLASPKPLIVWRESFERGTQSTKLSCFFLPWKFPPIQYIYTFVLCQQTICKHVQCTHAHTIIMVQSLLNEEGLAKVERVANMTQEALNQGNYAQATALWGEAEGVIESVRNNMYILHT